MNSKRIIDNILIKYSIRIYLIPIYYLIIYSIIPKIHSLKYFRAYNLISSKKILLLSDEGIQLYDPNSRNITLILNLYSMVSSTSSLELVSFAECE